MTQMVQQMVQHDPNGTTNGTTHPAATTSSGDLLKSREWTGQFFTGAAQLPVSFVFDERSLRGIPEEWQPVSARHRIDANISETVFEGTDSGTGLNIRVEYTEYHDYPVVEWVVWFTNNGDEATPVIRDILPMDGTFSGSSPVLYHCNGDFCSEESYTPEETSLTAGDTLEFAPNGGRSCDGAFPYYRVNFEGCGLTIAIGWPGQWAANFHGLGDGVHVQAGQEKTHLRLMPGESIRTPKITILAWIGDAIRAVNLWRRWYLAHILPRPNGHPIRPLLACCAPDDGVEFTSATEENQLRYIEKAKQRGIPFDVWWVDAGWYPCYDDDHERKWQITGSWEPDTERFPNGLKPVSDCAARNGADQLIWFEPERVRPGTKLDVEHPEWLLLVKATDEGQLTGKEQANRMLNLGIPECRQWLTDHICRLIKDNGIKIYRQDFNFEPLRYWRMNDDPDRQGMNENLHVQGYLQFWDDLLDRNPGLWIDSCSSGGRRNDIDTMRRSVPLHYTDYGYGDHPVKLAFHRTLYEWIPYYKECTLSWNAGKRPRFDDRIDRFSFHCGMAPMMFATLDIRRDDYDYDLARKMFDIWRRASDFFLYGDYYPLTPFHRNPAEWVAWQFDQPESGRGIIQGIRLPESPQESSTFRPQGILPNSMYFLENAETCEKKEIAGDDLIHDGFTLELPKRSGAIWFYRMKVFSESNRVSTS